MARENLLVGLIGLFLLAIGITFFSALSIVGVLVLSVQAVLGQSIWTTIISLIILLSMSLCSIIVGLHIINKHGGLLVRLLVALLGIGAIILGISIGIGSAATALPISVMLFIIGATFIDYGMKTSALPIISKVVAKV
jgi:hypothetical protein